MSRFATALYKIHERLLATGRSLHARALGLASNRASAAAAAPAKKPGHVVAADGRIGRPDIFEYETEDGRRHAVQPREIRPHSLRAYDGVPYRVIVHDRAAYERLIQTGWLNGPEHSGPREPIVDRRRTS